MGRDVNGKWTDGPRSVALTSARRWTARSGPNKPIGGREPRPPSPPWRRPGAPAQRALVEESARDRGGYDDEEAPRHSAREGDGRGGVAVVVLVRPVEMGRLPPPMPCRPAARPRCC